MTNPFVPRDLKSVNRSILLETLTWHRAMMAALKDDASERAQKIRSQVRQSRQLICRELQRRDERAGARVRQRVRVR